MAIDATHEELEAGRGYETLFVPALFAPWTDHLLAAAEITPGKHVLDIACGTGVLTRAAHDRAGKTGRVVGLDPARGMLAAANEARPDINWVLGSAESLPFDDGTFDCVTSQFGMMFFQDRLQATREMARVSKPEGKVALAMWCALDQNPAYRDVVDLLADQVSPEAADAVKMPFCLGNPDEVVNLLVQAGFRDISVETKKEQAEFPSTRTMVDVELRGWLPLFDIRLGEDKISAVLDASDAALARYATATGTAAFPASAYIVTARK